MENKIENYWTNRYETASTGWDLGETSMPLKTYIDQLENKKIRILIWICIEKYFSLHPILEF